MPYDNPTESGGVDLPVSVANGGTGATTAASARTNLGLGTAAVLNTGTSSGDIPVLGVGGALPAVSGANLTNLPTPTVNKAELWHLGAVSYYSTITLAEAAAVSGDTIVCYGTFDENGLGKDGIGYLFPPGSGITYTGQNNQAIWDTGGSAMNFRVDGAGKFLRDASALNPTQGAIIYLRDNAAAEVFFEAALIQIDTGGSGTYIGTNTKLYIDVDKAVKTGDANAVYISNGLVIGRIGEIESLTGRGVEVVGSGGYTSLAIDRIRCAYWGVNWGNTVSGGGVIRVNTIVSTNGSFGAVKVSQGTLYMDVAGECTSASDTVEMAGGTATFEGRFKTTGSNKSAFNITGGSLRIEGGSTLIGDGSGNCFTAAASQEVKILGAVVANLDKHSNVTLLCGTLEVDTDVN